MVEVKPFGTVNGKEAGLLTLKTPSLEVDVSTLGACLVAVRVLVKGEWVDVILGYETAEQYPPKGKPNFGTVVGRCANRIKGGKFELDGKEYQLDVNNGPNHLHGGLAGYYSQVWTVNHDRSSPTTLTLELEEADGHMGYPGAVKICVEYTLKDSELHFKYTGHTDAPTIISMTNHGYWNLKGQSAGDVLDHKLSVAGSRITKVDESLAITGELVNVEGTGLDLRSGPCLRDAVEKAGPIDANYCLDNPEGEFHAATLSAPNGLSMEIWTDQPGLQVMTGQNIDPSNADFWHGKGSQWQKFGAICLEPQLWPDGINNKDFPSPIVRPGETYTHHSWHVFKAD